MTVDELVKWKRAESVPMLARLSARFVLWPAHLLVPVAFGIALLGAASPIDDLNDAFWHVVVGDEIRATRSVTGVGDSWAWYDPPEPWTTSQWLAEVGMSWGVGVVGWGWLVLSTLALGAAILASLWWVLSTRANPWVSAGLFTGLALPLSLSFQTRPGMVSLLGAVWIGNFSDKVLARGQLPSWWLLPVVTLWANLHGGWVIAPAAIGLAVLLHWLESPRQRRSVALRGSLYVAGLLLAGSVTPLGPKGLWLPFTLRSATGHIGEWQATALFNGFALPLAVVLVAVMVGWARSRASVPVAEILFVIALSAFGLLAYRNVAVAAVVLAPLVARRLDEVFGSRERPTGTREQRLLRGSLAALSLGIAAWVGGQLVINEPLDRAAPLRIAQTLARGPTDVRVLNHYNASGVLVAFGPPGIELGIDGRAERYGGEYIDDYLDVFALSGDVWPAFLAEFEPQAAVAQADQAIVHYLRDDLGWRVAVTDGKWLLLEPGSRTL